MEIFITVIALIAFVGFVAWKIVEDDDTPSSGSGTGGGRSEPGVRPVEK